MSESLYRKYRPKKFADVIGQDHVVKVLESSAKTGHIAHAYLFSGSRGTGKTSIARIFADAIGATPSDIYEIDAASNRQVEDARALREGVAVVPFESPYKVYILDEVHMLTKEAFNTLLKTLEEPPKHAVFILATTEIHKVPDTIVSRCQTYTFNTPTRDVLREAIMRVAKKEKYEISKDTADLIARVGNGSFRDAYGALQKVTVHSGDKSLTREEVMDILGLPKDEYARIIAESLVLGDTNSGLEAILQAKNTNLDGNFLLLGVIDIIRGALSYKISPQGIPAMLDVLSPADKILAQELFQKNTGRLTSKLLLSLLDATILSQRLPEPLYALEYVLFSADENAKGN